MLSVIILNVKMLSVIMLSVIMLSVIMLSVIMLSIIMLSVIMLSVVAAFHKLSILSTHYNSVSFHLLTPLPSCRGTKILGKTHSILQSLRFN